MPQPSRSADPPGPSPAWAWHSWLDSAHGQHASAPASITTALLSHANALPADGDGAEAITLAEHVWLGHLGDAPGLLQWLGLLPDRLWQAEPTQAALQRAAWAAWQVRQHTASAVPAPVPSPDDQPRWRALQNVVLALAHLGHGQAADAMLMAQELPAAAHGSSGAGKAFAATANNIASHLADGPRGDTSRDTLMLDAATLARRAWGRAGTWLHGQRAEYRLALCHALLGHADAALHHARLCLAGCAAGDGRQPADAMEHFFAHEALARAHLVAQQPAGVLQATERMQALLPGIPQDDGLQAWCRQVLAQLPAA